MRDRSNINIQKSKISSVDSGEKIKESTRELYDTFMRNMTKGSIERFRELKKKKLIPACTYNTWVDDLILDELARLEAKAKAKGL